MIRLQAGCLCGIVVQFVTGSRNFSFFQSVWTSPGTHPHACSVNRHFVQDHSGWFVRLTAHPPSSVEVKNWCSYTLTVPYTFMVGTRVTTCTFLLSQKPCRSEWKWNSWLHINMCEMFGQAISDDWWNCAKTWETQVPPALFSKSVHQRQVHSKIFTINSCNLPNNRSLVSCKVSFLQSVT